MESFTDLQNKLRGGYYTPELIADFLTTWALRGLDSADILEPSFGDGVFLKSVQRYAGQDAPIDFKLTGVELFSSEYEKALDSINPNLKDKFSLINADFFSTYESLNKVDVVLGNPPFIRYQNVPIEHREKALEILNKQGFHPNKMTNAWALFLLSAMTLLKPKGKLAMVIPAELLQVKYAQPIREFISASFERTTIVSFERLVFENIQQEVVLLLCERDPELEKGIDLIEIKDVEELNKLLDTVDKPTHFKKIDHQTDKWTQYYLTSKEIKALGHLKANPKLSKLGDILDVDVGVVTGNNSFFVLNKETVDKYDLSDFVLELVGRSKQLNGGLIFHRSDWEQYNEANYPVYLLSLDNVGEIKHLGLKAYLKSGHENDVHKGYKCRIRKNWYIVPSIWTPKLLMLRQIHDYPRFILNDANAIPTDTIHRVKIFDNHSPEKIALSFLNSVSFLFSELMGRSYGGGILEIEPKEVDNIPVPFFESPELDVAVIDKILREKGIEEVLNITDEELLVKQAGLSPTLVSDARKMWKKLRERRLNRGRNK